MRIVPRQGWRRGQCWGQADFLWYRRSEQYHLCRKAKRTCVIVLPSTIIISQPDHSDCNIQLKNCGTGPFSCLQRQQPSHRKASLQLHCLCCVAVRQWNLEKCWRAQSHCRLTDLPGWVEVTFQITLHMTRADLDQSSFHCNTQLYIWPCRLAGRIPRGKLRRESQLTDLGAEFQQQRLWTPISLHSLCLCPPKRFHSSPKIKQREVRWT